MLESGIKEDAHIKEEAEKVDEAHEDEKNEVEVEEKGEDKEVPQMPALSD